MEQLLPDGLLADRLLVDRVLAGEPSAILELLTERCGRRIAHLIWVYRFEDLPNELYLSLAENDWRRLRTWKGEGSIQKWVSCVAVHLCLAHVKETRREVPLYPVGGGEIDPPSPDSAQTMDNELLFREVLRTIESLENPLERLVMRLHIAEGMGLEKIAERLDLSRSYVDTLKHRATKNLKKKLGGDPSNA